MLRRAPLRAKRLTPRRNEGRVQHKRIKRPRVSKTAEEARHLKTVAGLGCLICGAPANVHHLMAAPGKRCRKDHRLVVPLCQRHHQGDHGVHGLGSEAAFLALWGVDLIEWGVRAWSLRDAPGDLFWTVGVTRCRAIAFASVQAHKGGRGVIPEQPEGRTTAATALDPPSTNRL